MKTVDLTMHSEFIGVIIPMKSGVIYKNQAGGTYCGQPSLEGIYIPLPIEYLHDLLGDPLQDRVCSYNPDLVQQFLVAIELNAYFEPFKDHASLPSLIKSSEGDIHMMEAWVPVRIKDEDLPGFEDFVGEWGVITYPNSD